MHTIAVIGLGYIGLPTAVVFAQKGYRVIGVDIDAKKVEAVNAGRSYIREPYLNEMLRDSVARGLLSATADAVVAVRQSDAVIIAVPTPVKNGVADLTYLREALDAVRKGIHRDLLIVIESTIPPGTTVGIAKPMLEETGMKVGQDIYLAHVPERIAPGKAVEELLNAPRVVGGADPRSTEKAIQLYSKVNPHLQPTDATTAEFVKLAENTYRDLNIALANLLALMAEKLGIDVYEAIRLANTHPRVNIHMPGAGVGGPCLTKDPYMLASIVPDFWGTELIRSARRINDYMPTHTVNIVEKALADAGLSVRGAKIAVLGAAYKGGVDDTRESPAKYVVQKLLEKGADVVVYDPYTPETFGARPAKTLEEAAKDADALVIVTDHPEFKKLDLVTLAALMRHRIIIDGRRAVEPHAAAAHGFTYYAVGYGKAYKL
jgi:UDP-N-acetyl-D-mannosaminuronic acid dehydrogenase